MRRTDTDVGKQIEYIRNYKLNRDEEKGLYYIIESCIDGKRIGTVRVYDVTESSFSGGSWIMSEEAQPYMAMECYFLTLGAYFDKFNKKTFYSSVKRENTKAYNFYTRMGSEVYKEENGEYFLTLSAEKFHNSKEKYKRYLP